MRHFSGADGLRGSRLALRLAGMTDVLTTPDRSASPVRAAPRSFRRRRAPDPRGSGRRSPARRAAGLWARRPTWVVPTGTAAAGKPSRLTVTISAWLASTCRVRSMSVVSKPISNGRSPQLGPTISGYCSSSSDQSRRCLVTWEKPLRYSREIDRRQHVAPQFHRLGAERIGIGLDRLPQHLADVGRHQLHPQFARGIDRRRRDLFDQRSRRWRAPRRPCAPHRRRRDG